LPAEFGPHSYHGFIPALQLTRNCFTEEPMPKILPLSAAVRKAPGSAGMKCAALWWR